MGGLCVLFQIQFCAPGPLPNDALFSSEMAHKTGKNRGIHNDKVIGNKKALDRNGLVAKQVAQERQSVKPNLGEKNGLKEKPTRYRQVEV